MNKALSESTNAITPELVKEVYPENLYTPRLQSLVDQMLSQISVQTEQEFETILESKGLNDRLLNLEKLILDARSNNDGNNSTVEDAVELLPSGITPQDVLRYTMHQLKIQEKERLMAECKAVETENVAVSRKIGEGKRRIEEKLRLLDEKRREIRKTADVCTMANSR